MWSSAPTQLNTIVNYPHNIFLTFFTALFQRYKSLTRFSICHNDSIWANAHDILPYGNEIYIISNLNIAKIYRICVTNISSKRSLHIFQSFIIQHDCYNPKNFGRPQGSPLHTQKDWNFHSSLLIII